MSTTLICLFPIVYTVALLWLGWYFGRHGSPVKWVGFTRRRGGPRRVAQTFEGVGYEHDH